MSIEKQYVELLESSYTELDKLKKEVTQLEDIRKRVETLVTTNGQLPELFVALNESLKTLAEEYIIGIKSVSEGFVSENNKTLIKQLSDFEKKLTDLKNQIDRLVNTDFTKLFKDLQKVFIDQTRTDLAIELKKFDEKSTDLQAKVDALKAEITRLEKIDLEKYFRELQRTLADIFTAVNGVNTTLTNIIQTLNGIVLSLGTIQTTLGTNHDEAKQLLNSFSETTEKHLIDQDEQATKNVELLESKMKSLSEQNELLKKEVKTNRIIQIVGLAIILIILIYIATK